VVVAYIFLEILLCITLSCGRSLCFFGDFYISTIFIFTLFKIAHFGMFVEVLERCEYCKTSLAFKTGYTSPACSLSWPIPTRLRGRVGKV
jgi:hypothetical protein